MVSTEQLFHFTKFEFLLKILDSGFYPHYNLEYVEVSDFDKQISVTLAIPMVCFCDLPLNLVKKHSDKYGKTAIGLSKEWGYINKINPVFYIQYNSVVADAISNQLSQVILLAKYMKKKDIRDKKMIGIMQQLYGSFMVLASFLKPYEYKEIITISHGKFCEQFQYGRFYDEREWRYIPMYKVQSHDELFMRMDIYEDINQRNKANENMRKYSLTFNLTDIEYIIVENKQQDIEIRNFLETKFKKNVFDKIKIEILDAL